MILSPTCGRWQLSSPPELAHALRSEFQNLSKTENKSLHVIVRRPVKTTTDDDPLKNKPQVNDAAPYIGES